MSDFEQQFKTNGEKSLLVNSLEKRNLPTVEDVCRDENCNAEELPGLLAERTKDILDYCRKHSSIIDDELSPQIDFIYRCFASTRGTPASVDLSGFSKSLKDFESFIAQYAKGVPRRAIGNLMERIDRYTRAVVHPSRIITVFPENHRMHGKLSIYKSEGQWIQLPSESDWSAREYVEMDVLEEIVNLQETGYTRPDLYHATGSASLSGIAKHKAILSARRARELGEDVKTGEYNTYIGWQDYSVSGGREGLSSIYTSRSPHTGYSIARWFDEYHLVFGLSIERIARYLKEHKGETDIRFADFAGEGIRIGPEAPLELVDVIYGEHIYLDDLDRWKSKYAPHARIVSLEADELLRSRGEQDFYSSSRGIKNWKSLLSQRPVVIK